ncbi:MAG: MFS transporter, partial [Novosphingobium sp.]|nr:MFS transporter [Novosphingobium sp.]
MEDDKPGAGQEWRENWPLLTAAMAGISFGAIPTATLGVFMEPLQDEFGWSRASLSLGLMIFALVSTPLSPFAGALVDRFGARAVAIPGVALCGLSFAAFSLMTGSVAFWLAVWMTYSLCALLIRSMVWNRAVSAAFVKSRGLAIAGLLSGTSLAGALAPITTQLLTEAFGWRGAYLVLGLGWAGIAWILVILFFREKAEPVVSDSHAPVRRTIPGGLTYGEALRSPVMIRIAVAVLL